MCGRFTLRDPVKAYAAFLRREVSGLPGPRFNIAPGQMLPIIRRGQTGQLQVEDLFWGLRTTHRPGSIVNSRAETAPHKPAFRESFRRRRCILPADGFYEWRTANSRKIPYFFRLRADKPFAFAAIWNEGQPTRSAEVGTFCLLTTAANSLLAPIHDRMPVMLTEGGAARWLQTPAEKAATELKALLHPFPPGEMESNPVDPWVNKVGHEGPRCIEPREDDEPEQLALL